MNADSYQKLAKRTLIDAPDFDISDQETMTIWNAIGLAGEAGEVCDLIKKGIFHQHGLDRDQIAKELGDVCWYLAALCTNLDLDLSAVMRANIKKLQARYPDGFNSQDSIVRLDLAVEAWESAKEHLDNVIAEYTRLRGQPGVNVEFALLLSLEPMRARYEAGERTPELYEEMVAAE